MSNTKPSLFKETRLVKKEIPLSQGKLDNLKNKVFGDSFRIGKTFYRWASWVGEDDAYAIEIDRMGGVSKDYESGYVKFVLESE